LSPPVKAESGFPRTHFFLTPPSPGQGRSISRPLASMHHGYVERPPDREVSPFFLLTPQTFRISPFPRLWRRCYPPLFQGSWRSKYVPHFQLFRYPVFSRHFYLLQRSFSRVIFPSPPWNRSFLSSFFLPGMVAFPASLPSLVATFPE